MGRSGQIIRYLSIKALQEEKRYPIDQLCRIANVSKSSYYKWKSHQPTQREKENEKLCEIIQRLYEKTKGIYGYRRITLAVRKETGKNYNEKRIRRLMKKLKLKSVIRQKRKRYKPCTEEIKAQNLLNRKFRANKPNEKWLTDVTEFKYGYKQEKKAYLSAILDLYDNSIISYEIGHRNNNPLVYQTIEKAIELYPEESVLFHSDRGFQYTSKRFVRILEEAGYTQSMSRVGRCIDNGPMEGFWGHLKSEMYYLNRFECYEDLKKAIDGYIYFYNTERVQIRFNGLAPLEVRNKTS